MIEDGCNGQKAVRGYAWIGLEQPKFDGNVGGCLRAAAVYGAAGVVVSGSRFERESTDTMKAWRHMPLLRVQSLQDAIPYDCVPVAVELHKRARSLITYEHPPRAFYIFGAEDHTLGDRVLSWCRDVVQVPTVRGRCMNLAATVNVVLYDRTAKGGCRP